MGNNDTDKVIRNFARKAAEDWRVTNNVRRSCPVTGTIIHNGKVVDEHH